MTASLQGVVLPSPPLYTVRVHPARALGRRYAFLCLRETFLRVSTCLLRRRGRDDSMSRRRAVVRSLEKRLLSKSLKIEGMATRTDRPLDLSTLAKSLIAIHEQIERKYRNSCYDHSKLIPLDTDSLFSRFHCYTYRDAASPRCLTESRDNLSDNILLQLFEAARSAC